MVNYELPEIRVESLSPESNNALNTAMKDFVKVLRRFEGGKPTALTIDPNMPLPGTTSPPPQPGPYPMDPGSGILEDYELPTLRIPELPDEDNDEMNQAFRREFENRCRELGPQALGAVAVAVIASVAGSVASTIVSKKVGD